MAVLKALQSSAVRLVLKWLRDEAKASVRWLSARSYPACILNKRAQTSSIREILDACDEPGLGRAGPGRTVPRAAGEQLLEAVVFGHSLTVQRNN